MNDYHLVADPYLTFRHLVAVVRFSASGLIYVLGMIKSFSGANFEL